jgi:hypothetical protein
MAVPEVVLSKEWLKATLALLALGGNPDAGHRRRRDRSDRARRASAPLAFMGVARRRDNQAGCPIGKLTFVDRRGV